MGITITATRLDNRNFHNSLSISVVTSPVLTERGSEAFGINQSPTVILYFCLINEWLVYVQQLLVLQENAVD